MFEAPPPAPVRQQVVSRLARWGHPEWATASIPDGLAQVLPGWEMVVDGNRVGHLADFVFTSADGWLLVPHPYRLAPGVSAPVRAGVDRWWDRRTWRQRRDAVASAVAASGFAGSLVDLTMLALANASSDPGVWFPVRDAVRAAVWSRQGAEQRAAMRVLHGLSPVPGLAQFLR